MDKLKTLTPETSSITAGNDLGRIRVLWRWFDFRTAVLEEWAISRYSIITIRCSTVHM